MAASLSGEFNLQGLTDAGLPAALYRLYTYDAGTTTQKTAYTDEAASVPHTYTSDGLGGQYIALNARGELPAPLFLASGSYDLALKRADGSSVWTRRAMGVDGVATALSTSLAAVTGGALVGWQRSGGVARTVSAKLNELHVTPEDFGAAGDGVTDDRAAIISALAFVYGLGGGEVILSRGRTYRISSRIQLGSYPGCAIVGPRSATIYAKAADFSNTSLSSKYTNTSAVLDFSGQTVGPYTKATGFRLQGFKILSEVSDGRMVDAITAQNAADFEVIGLEITGFPVGCGIRASTLSGRCIFEKNFIHDFTSASAWGTQPQITGIEIDGDRVNSVGSSGVRIINNRITALTMTGSALTTYGFQTDGINLQGTYPNSTTLCHIAGNIINNVGEGIDCFGSYNNFAGNELSNCYDYGLKFVHGASFNVIDGAVIINPGRAGVGLFGSTTVGVGDTDRNSFNDLTIAEINPSARVVSNPACVLIDDNGGTTGKPRNNSFTGGNWSLGTNGQYGVCDQSTGSGNLVTGPAISTGGAALKKIRVDNGGTVACLAGANVYAIDDATTTLASAATITPVADTYFVSGVAAIATITVPTRLAEGGQITLIPSAIWTTTTAGNIALASTAVVSKAMVMTYVKTTGKWYPSY